VALELGGPPAEAKGATAAGGGNLAPGYAPPPENQEGEQPTSGGAPVLNEIEKKLESLTVLEQYDCAVPAKGALSSAGSRRASAKTIREIIVLNNRLCRTNTTIVE
jgi:hypothetical protein